MSRTVTDQLIKEVAGLTTTLSHTTITKMTVEQPRSAMDAGTYAEHRLSYYKREQRRARKQALPIEEKDSKTGVTRFWIFLEGEWVARTAMEQAIEDSRR